LKFNLKFNDLWFNFFGWGNFVYYTTLDCCFGHLILAFRIVLNLTTVFVVGGDNVSNVVMWLNPGLPDVPWGAACDVIHHPAGRQKSAVTGCHTIALALSANLISYTETFELHIRGMNSVPGLPQYSRNYSPAPHNDVSVNDVPHIRRLSH
jgi:hypothetical protein